MAVRSPYCFHGTGTKGRVSSCLCYWSPGAASASCCCQTHSQSFLYLDPTQLILLILQKAGAMTQVVEGLPGPCTAILCDGI